MAGGRLIGGTAASVVCISSAESTDWVYIIDFSLATRSRDASESCRLNGEFIGTEGWTAPEVGMGKPYDAAKADLWAAGKVILEFCRGIGLDEETWEFVKRLSIELMDLDPAKRPQIQDACSRVKARLSDSPVSNLPDTLTAVKLFAGNER